MKTNIMLRYAKSNWTCDEFGKGKTKTSKRRFRKFIKVRAKNRFNHDYNEQSEASGN